MRKNSFLFVVMLSTALSLGFASCDNDNGNDPNDPTTGNDSGKENDPTAVPPTCTDYVDLGLSVKWATCNVGASSPEEYGSYFAWGEVNPKTIYNWNTYKWATAIWNEEYSEWSCETSTKYNTVDNKKTLDYEDDAATVNMGKNWRMPTIEEQQELIENCTWTWIDDYCKTGIAGNIITSKINGNSIFLPAASHHDQNNKYGDSYDDTYDVEEDPCGFYWSNSIYTYPEEEDPLYVCYIYSTPNNSFLYYSPPYVGKSVRAVRE